MDRRIDQPTVGLFKTRMTKGGPWLAACIVSRASQPDRSPRLLCFVAGEEVDLTDWWPRLHPVGEAEFRRLLAATPDDTRKPVALADAAPMF